VEFLCGLFFLPSIVFISLFSALQLENIPWWGKNILRGGGGKNMLNIIKYITIQKASGFRGKTAARGGGRMLPGPP